MKYYKVAEVRNKKLYSAFTNHWGTYSDATAMKKQGIRYYVNKWVYPKKNAKQALFVFSRYDIARAWSKSIHGIARIYECEIGKVLVEDRDIWDDVALNFNNNMNTVMANITVIAGYKPYNCVLVDKVKLTKRIK